MAMISILFQTWIGEMDHLQEPIHIDRKIPGLSAWIFPGGLPRQASGAAGGSGAQALGLWDVIRPIEAISHWTLYYYYDYDYYYSITIIINML